MNRINNCIFVKRKRIFYGSLIFGQKKNCEEMCKNTENIVIII